LLSSPLQSIRSFQVPVAELQMICERAREIFQAESTLIEVDAPTTVVGDVHGQFSDLLRIFQRKGFPHGQNYVFLGGWSLLHHCC